MDTKGGLLHQALAEELGRLIANGMSVEALDNCPTLLDVCGAGSTTGHEASRIVHRALRQATERIARSEGLIPYSLIGQRRKSPKTPRQVKNALDIALRLTNEAKGMLTKDAFYAAVAKALGQRSDKTGRRICQTFLPRVLATELIVTGKPAELAPAPPPAASDDDTPALDLAGANPKDFRYRPVSVDLFAGADRRVRLDPHRLLPGQPAWVVVTVRNAGKVPWTSRGRTPTRLGTKEDHYGVLRAAGWLSVTRAATLSESLVGPGELGTFEFPIQLPAVPGSNREFFNVLAEHWTWADDQGIAVEYTVVPPPDAGPT